ncbi:MAG: InlB B-repeat-containing protein [Acutalibacteraceae bacterium]|nr:InlB B-repeat-containing protein [Acutalibacteraceae bacterium]
MKRLLAIILASLLILSSATAGASAYQAYKDDALTKYDFTDTAVLTTEQYASALLDYADKALAKENITMDLSILGKLDATSIDNALSSVYKLINGNKIILWMAGDLNSVNVDAIKNPRRSNTTDVAVIKALLQFLADNKGIVKKVVVGGVGKYKRDGGVSLGVANSFVKVDLNVEVMLREMIWGLAYPNTEYNSSNNIDSMLQVIIQNALAGVKEIPDSVKNLVDLNSTKSTYDFIEDLLQTAYNDIAVPMLNDQTMKWLGQEIDKDTTGTLAGLFNRDFRVSAYTVPAGSTLVAELNNIAGGIVNGLLKNYNGWVSGDNSKLTDNVVAVARYILKETGDYFFPDWQKHIATAEEIDAMSKEELIAYLARSIINASVGYMYIPEDVTTVIGVAWEAVKQLMAQFLPERDYSGYPKTVQGILDMLADFVAYNVNPGIDLNAGDPKKALNYGDGMDKMLTTAVQWLAADPQYYTGLLPSTTIDTSDGWKALDDIFFKLLDKSVLPAKFANSGSETILKDIVYSILNGLLVDQDLTCISDLFVKNESGAFATQTLKQSIVRLVTDILNAVLPGTVTKTYGSLNEIVSNSELGSIVENLLGSLNSNKDKLVPPIVNIVAQVMKLTDKAKFKEMEIAGSKRIKNSSELDLTVYNGSQGINRGYTDKNNNFTQDKLPRYTIDSWSAVAYNYDGSKQKDLSVSGLTANEELNGGDNRSVKISGIDSNNTLVVFTVYYFALDEAGNKLTNDASVCRFYSYRLDGADVDNNTSGINTGSNKTSASVNDCPPKLLLFNQNNTNPLKTICAQSVTFKVPKGKGAHTGSNASANLGGLSSNLKSATSSASMDGGNAISGSNAYDSIDLWEETASIAKFEVGFDTTINWAATAKKGNKTDHYNGATRIICYNDYGLHELYNIEAGKNRARTDYDSSADAAWDAYITALNNAAIYTLLPGTIALYTNSEFLAGFEARQKALASAVETLETHLVSASVDSLKTAVEAVQGKDNAEGAVYWDDGYNYFGYDDFNSVTWNGWKEARNRALNLYNSTIAPKEPVAPEKPGDDATLIENQKYDKAYAQWQTDHAAWETAIAAWQMPTISAIDVAYAEQQVALWGPRLIKLAAVKTHLDAAIKMCTIDSADASKYDADRWEAYAKSFAYAQKVSTSFNASTTMRTQVREAMNNLIYNWKRLIANPVVTVTFTFTVNGETHAVLTGNQGDPVDLSSIEAPAAPVGMHFVGWGNVPATFDADATFEAQFANNTDTKYTVNVYNMDTTGNYPATPDSTYQGAGETNSTADITADAVAAEGFSLDSAKSTLTGTIAADGSLVLSIYYSRNQYTITYANTDLEPDTYYYGATVSARTPEKAGYAFQGWEEEVPSTMPAQNITLTAKWNENPADYTDYDIAVAAANAKKAEANYDKTYTEASRKALDAALAVDVSGKKLSEQGVVDAQTAAINAAVKGLEKMTYNATFYVDGEEYRVVPTKVGEQIVAPEAPSKQGYTFTGWTPEVGTMGIEDVSFNAVFSAGTVAYTVETYVMDVNGNYGDAAIENKSATTGETVSVTPEAREGFSVAAESVLSGEVKADGSLVLKVYYSRNQYKLTVDGNVTNVYYGAAISVAEPAAREGYTFAGWDRDVPETMPASDVTLVSQWNENDADYTAYNAAKAAAEAKQAEANFDKTYTAESRQALADALAKDVSGKKYTQQGEVDAAAKAINDAVTALELMTYKATFYVDGAEYKVVTAKVGEAIAKPDDPSKTGYVFTGWDPEVGTMGTEDISFNAKFSAGEVSYTVETYVMGLDGQYGAADSKNVAATTGAEITLTPDAREGFTVAGESVLTGTVAADSSLVLKVYYSRNQYKLTVDGTTTEVYYGAALEIADPEARTGYTFAGWKPAAPAIMPANDVTLESQWTENGADYTAYDAAVKVAQAKQAESDYAARYTEESRNALAAALAADVSGKKYTQQGEVDAATTAINNAVAGLDKMTYNAIFTVDGAEYAKVPTKVDDQIVAPKDPAKEGYVFKGWDKEVGKMGVEDITFAAQFEEASGIAYTVEVYTMDVNGNYGAAETKTLYGTTDAEVTADTTAAEGFTFDESAANVVSGTVAADGSLVLKVYFARNQYKLTVDGAESEVYYGAALDIATPAAREGYTFIGWNVDVPANMPASDLTLVSQWSENDADYTAYNAAVAAAQAKKAETDYDKTYTAESRAALDAALAEKVSGKKYSEQSVVDAAAKAINDAVASLEVMTYNATFYVDGTEYRVVPTKVGEQIIAPENPTKEGFVFTGWDKKVGVMGTEDVSFNAQFSAGEVSYKVETYVMDVNGAYGAADVKVVPATTGAAVSVDPEAREGFTVAADSVLSGTVAADGSLVLKVYYSRNQYKLTVDGAESMVYYGAELNIAEPTKDHYTFAGWNVEVPATMPASDLTLVSQWTEEGADYTAYDAAVKAAQAKKAEADYDKTYTAESRAALDAALAIDVANKKYSEQADVDAATAAINDAVKALELMTYTANFYVNGQLYKAVTAKVGEQIIAPKDPSVDGYNFNGWDPAVGTMGTEDVRFDAILVANNSSIISVTPETPNYGGMHQYAVKVKGEPLKIKIVDANGNTRTFDRNTSMTSDANALGILKIEKTEDGEIWLINANLAEGKFTAYAKMAKEYWENDGYGFTVSFDQKPEPKIGDVTEVTYDTPNYGGKQDYRVKVTDKAGKIQFVYANGGTTTLTRLDPRVSIKSYDAQGNEVYANSTNLAYEIWTVNFNLPAGNYVVRAKYGRNTWSEGLAVNVVISAKPATAVSVTEVNTSADSVAVTVNGTAKKVKITYASGATRTFNRDDANVSIASDGDGEIWTINVKLTEGDYTATAKYIDNGKQVWDTTDFAFTV